MNMLKSELSKKSHKGAETIRAVKKMKHSLMSWKISEPAMAKKRNKEYS